MSTEQDTEHLDPNQLPPWLLEHAAKASPDALAWLAAGYLAGIQVGRKAGPCMASLKPIFDGAQTINCELAHGHVGGHSNERGTKWTEVGL